MLILVAVLSVCLQCVLGASLQKVHKVIPAKAPKVDPWTYLGKFGYIGKQEQAEADSAVSSTGGFLGRFKKDLILKSAIRRFQKFARLNQTGIADNQTITLMQTPRCGVTDNNGTVVDPKLRYVLGGSKWPKKSLTWRLGVSTTQSIPRSTIEGEIARAFNIWSDVADLTFTRVASGPVDIDIFFGKGDHGDGSSFDGPGGVLAHAFYPSNGDAHLDDAEIWTVSGYTGNNLLQIMGHEFGHSLGLSHSDKASALMAPFYLGYQPNFRLDSDDILGIQALYGRKVGPRIPSLTPAPPIPFPDPFPFPFPPPSPGFPNWPGFPSGPGAPGPEGPSWPEYPSGPPPPSGPGIPSGPVDPLP